MPELAPVLERMLALWNGEDVDARSVYAYGCVANGGEEVFDPDSIPPVVAALRAGAPDLRFEVLDWFAGRLAVRSPASCGRHPPRPARHADRRSGADGPQLLDARHRGLRGARRPHHGRLGRLEPRRAVRRSRGAVLTAAQKIVLET